MAHGTTRASRGRVCPFGAVQLRGGEPQAFYAGRCPTCGGTSGLIEVTSTHNRMSNLRALMVSGRSTYFCTISRHFLAWHLSRISASPQATEMPRPRERPTLLRGGGRGQI